MRLAIAGASGYVGRTLVSHLAEQGHDVVAIGRRLDALPAGERIVRAAVDVADADALAGALTGVDAAYYLVHSMAGPSFERRDAELARAFAHAAAEARVGRIVYLGALGGGELSRHLASRHEVGAALASTGVAVVELRAAVILGAGSISFEMLRYLVERLPAMVCPRWVRTRIEPVAERDVFAYLVRALGVEPGVYEIGCGEVTSYRELMDIYTGERGLRKRLILNVPLLTLRLSSYWVDLVTPVDRRVSHTLIESLASEVVVSDHARTRAAFGNAPTPLPAAVRAALDDQLAQISGDLLDRAPGLRDGVYTVRLMYPIDRSAAEAARRQLADVGGDLRWYGLPWAWRLRLALGNLLGEDNRLARPSRLEPEVAADWWTVDRASGNELVLRSRAWVTGESWLGYAVREDSSLVQAAAFRPKGIPGLLYWKLLRPIHATVFRAMARSRVKRAREE